MKIDQVHKSNEHRIGHPRNGCDSHNEAHKEKKMFDHEIVIGEEKLKLAIQSEIMKRINELRQTTDIGYTSWTVSESIVDNIKSYKQKSKKNIDIYDAKL